MGTIKDLVMRSGEGGGKVPIYTVSSDILNQHVLASGTWNPAVEELCAYSISCYGHISTKGIELEIPDSGGDLIHVCGRVTGYKFVAPPGATGINITNGDSVNDIWVTLMKLT